jgi:hypothetical protein
MRRRVGSPNALVMAETAEVNPSGEKGSVATPVFYLSP